MSPTLIYIYIYIYIIREEEGQSSRESFSLFFLFSSLLFLIYGVSIVRIHRAKNESSSTRQGLCVSIKNTGFQREFK